MSQLWVVRVEESNTEGHGLDHSDCLFEGDIVGEGGGCVLILRPRLSSEATEGRG